MEGDLSALKPHDSATIQLVDPRNGEPLSDSHGTLMSVTVLGQDSETYQREQHLVATKRLNKRLSVGKRLKMSAEELEKDSLDILVKCTVSWTGIQFNGKLLECTPDNVRTIYSELPWVREQVAEFVSERENFLGNS